jgi:hypothetical protein
MSSKLDIVFIIKKLIEIDKLKRVLLDENQIKLFDYIPKPTVPLPNNNLVAVTERTTELDYFQKEKSFNEKIVEALAAYK